MISNYHTVMNRFYILMLIIFFIGFLSLSACSSPATDIPPANSTPQAVEAVNPLFSDPFAGENENANDTESTQGTPTQIQSETNISGIVIDLARESKPISPLLLGTNVPAWLGKERVTNETFIERTKASGVSMLRIPGGSWSNHYNWLPCEQENICPWDWGVLTPSDFINLINATELEAMYTTNMNGTAKEAAALVAFFNGSVEDETVIGVDVLGYDWGTVSEWAQLRSDHGNPNPVGIKYWEVGNEIYAGKLDMGTDCNQSWGWEDVWTCDGTEYVTGIGDGDQRREGFIEYAEAMKAVDPSILVGAVGVSPQDEWNNWGYEVITNADDVLDFYSIHEYGYFDAPRDNETILAKPQSVWGPMMENVKEAFSTVGNGRFPPIAITEYNLIAAQNKDNDQLMTQALNMLFLADTIGQMATHEFAIANQWNIANGQAENGTDYGLLHANSFERYPQYYVFPLWAQFGTDLLPIASSFANETTLSAYAGKHEDGTITLLAINKTSDPINSNIQFLNAPDSFTSGLVDVVQAPSLESQQVLWNGVTNPANDFSDAPSTIFEIGENPEYTFAPYSITLIKFLP